MNTIARFAPHHERRVAELFGIIATDATAGMFHPHPFTAQEAHRVCNSLGKDIYVGLFSDGELLGYGMLRGWDEGYAIPSIGIYVVPNVRRRGFARFLMDELHHLALGQKASYVRLRVAPENERARRLYESIGYEFNGDVERGQFVGLLNLATYSTCVCCVSSV